jgi:rod shape-determining protein MreC
VRGVFQNKIVVVVFTTLLLFAFIILSSIPGSILNNLTTPVSIVLGPVQKAIYTEMTRAGDIYAAFREGLRIRTENEKLRTENAALKNKITQLEEAGRQYNALKDALLLKDRYDNYTLIGSRVLTRGIGSWFDVFRIDSGQKDGLNVTETTSYAVVDAQSRLVGRILSTDLTTARILPLLHAGFAMSAKINTVTGALVRVRGDIDLKERGFCAIDQIPTSAVIRVGDEIITSGAGGLFPAGLPIGVISEIRDTGTRLNRTAIMKPYIDLESIDTVFVMKGKE